MQSFQDMDELNMFKDDNTVMHFKKPQISYASFAENSHFVFLTGNPETKNMMDMMPDILKQVGPKQYGMLKDLLGKAGLGPKNEDENENDEDDDDDIPDLVGTFEDVEEMKSSERVDDQEDIPDLSGSFEDVS